MDSARSLDFDLDVGAGIDRRRVGWWLVAAVLLGVSAFFVLSFVGTFVLGVFVYYGARPINRWIRHRIGSRGAAATITLLFIVLPTLALVAYTGVLAWREFTAVVGPDAVNLLLDRLPGNQQSIAGALSNLPQLVGRLGQLSGLQRTLTGALGALGTISNGLLHLTLAFTFAFFCLRDGHRANAWYETEVGGQDTAAYSYLAGVDADLEVVYFGNVLTVLAVTIGSILVYNAYNFLAPGAVMLPFPTLLAVLTGLATFVPLVVGKIVYVPAAAYLLWGALRTDASLLVYPITFLVVAFLALDIIPQSIVRPYISGQTLHEGAVLFAYILGAALFGWYGLFLGPLLLVLVVQFANVALSDLLYGRAFSPAPTGAATLGTDPADARVNAVSTDDGDGADGATDADATDDSDSAANDVSGDADDDDIDDGDDTDRREA